MTDNSARFDCNPVYERTARAAYYTTDPIVANLFKNEHDDGLPYTEQQRDLISEQLVDLRLKPAPLDPSLIEYEIALGTSPK